MVDAHINATAVLQCQRCLQEMSCRLPPLRWAACGRMRRQQRLPGRYEPLLIEEDANLREIAEEELLLALPAFPLHENDCKTVEQRLRSQPRGG